MTKKKPAHPTAVATPLPSSALVRPDVVTRKKAASLLGISPTTLRRRHEGKTLPVEVDEAGVHFFALSAVQVLARELCVVPVNDAPDNDEPARYAHLFELFDEKMHPVDVVKKLRSELPAFVDGAYAQWLRMRRGLVLDPEHVSALRHTAMWSSSRRAVAFETADDVVALVKEALEAPPRQRVCLLCAKKAATVCSTCLGQGQNAERQAKREHERAMRKLDVDAEKARVAYAREAADLARQHEQEAQRSHERHMAELAARRGKQPVG